MDDSFPSTPPRVVEGITLKFPAKLWRIVNGCMSGAISWSPDGTSIKINKRRFEMEYLNSNKYFKTVNFPSFVRQLNIYGFRKQAGSGRWYEKIGVFEYKHRCFHEGRPELLSQVTRNIVARKERGCNKIYRSTNSRGKIDVPVHRPSSLDHSVYEPISLATPSLFHALLRSPDMEGTGPDPEPRTLGCEMQLISPRRLHDQVADVLTGVDPMEPGPAKERSASHGLISRESSPSPVDDIIEIHEPSPDSPEAAATTTPSLYPKSNPILFVPRHPDMETVYMEKKLSELNVDFLTDSSDNSQENPELMLSSAAGKETDDFADVLNEVLGKTVDCLNKHANTIEWACSDMCQGPDHGSPLISCARYGTDGIGYGADQIAVGTEFEEIDKGAMEDTVFTPAYFDPITGTVTLLLPKTVDDAYRYNL